MKKRKINLHLLDGAEAGSAEGNAQVAESGKAETDDRVAAGEGAKSSFKDLIEGEYKADFEKEIKSRVEKRLKNSGEAEAKLKALNPTLGLLAKRYGLNAEALDYEALSKAITEDDAYYEQAAIAAGMDVQTFKKMEQIKMQNAQLEAEVRRNRAEAEQREMFNALAAQEADVKAVYPGFSLSNELGNKEFSRLVFNNVPVKTAYEVVHRDEIIGGAMQFTAKKVEKQIVDNILAGQQRPTEQGLSKQPGVVTKVDPSKLTKEQREDIRKRVMRGERITFD